MITKPIIPIWLMSVICIVLIILVIYNKNSKNEKVPNRSIKRKILKLAIIAMLFVINLRIMLPDGESTIVTSDLNVLFVIDKSVSMKALDYNGNKERLSGVKSDLCYIVDELAGSKFSIITFGDSARRIIPFTADADVVQAEIKALSLENEYYAQGTSMNMPKKVLEKTLKDEIDRKGTNTKIVVFFISDGEITKENESLESFSNIKQYILDGAVMGYGTTKGGKMVNSTYEEEPYSEYYYIYYYDENYNMTQAVSKIDEGNLRSIARDLGVEYVHMEKKSDIDSKIRDIKNQMLNSNKEEKKTKSYKDTYYYFAIPLAMLLMIDLMSKKRSM